MLVPGSYIVTLKAPGGSRAPAAWTAETARELTHRVGGRLGSVYTAALTGFSASMSAEQAATLGRDPRVEAVEQDSFLRAASSARSSPVEGASAQPSAPWHLDRIDQPNASLSGTYDSDGDAANVSIYVIDSGVRVTHREFGGRAKKAPHPFDSNDCTGHGTAVAGAAAGETFGVAKKATVYSVNGVGCDEIGPATKTLDAIEWVTKNAQRPAVANLSWGGLTEQVEAAIRNSIDSGITWVLAIGNERRDNCTQSPQRLREAIVVAATDRDDNAAGYSAYGPCVDLYAPGSGITTASWDNDTATVTSSGTSIAAPIVAGAAALYLSKHPAATPREVEAALVACATTDAIGKLPPSSPDRLLNTRCPNGFTVTNPGHQRFMAGRPVHLDKLKAHGGDGSTLRYQATGLPAGLSIDGTTGVISGTPSTEKESAAKEGTVKVTVTAGSASTSTTFRWALIAGYGHITTGDDTCLDHTFNTGPLQLWECNQRWAVHTDGTIQFEDTTPAKCITAPDQATPDEPVVLSACAGADTQIWPANETGRLVNAATGKCLSALRSGHGHPVVLAECSDEVEIQTWKLPDGIPGDITVGQPGVQSNLKGIRVRLRVAAETYDTTMNLRYSATGLPDGLTMNADTGMISGAAADPGTSTVKVTATGSNGATSSETFRWQIADGPITGIDGMCIDHGGGDAQPAQLFACNNTGPQLVTVRPDGRLEVIGRCMTVAGEATADGSAVVFAECGEAASQVWRQGADGTLRNTAAGRCLTAPDSSSRTRLTVTECTGAGNQLWRLPTAPPSSLTNPGRQDLTIYAAVDITTAAGKPSGAYAATGLPAGLSIDATTGRITGRASAIGSGTAVVTASGTSGVTDRIAFVWSVRHGRIHGKDPYCVENREALTEENNPIVVNRCSRSLGQLWTVRSGGGLEASGKCMTAAAKSDDADAPIVLRSCDGGDNQQWRQQPDGTVRNPASGKCLTASKLSNHAAFILSACAGGDTQQWLLPAVDHGPPAVITDVSGSWCAEVLADGVVEALNRRLVLSDCTHGPEQTWMVNADDRVLHQATGKCITPAANGTAGGTVVVVAPCSDSNRAQEWRQRPDGTIVNVASGRCLYVSGFHYGAWLALADCTADNHRLWKLPTKPTK